MGRISRPGLTGGAGRPLGAWSPRGGAHADAHKKIRGKTPKGEASFGLTTFLSEWGGRLTARVAAWLSRRAVTLAARGCHPGCQGGAQGCHGDSQGGSPALPLWQRRAATLTALRPSRAAALWRPAPLAAALHPVTTVGRGPGGAKESLGVEGHCRSLGLEPGRRARFGCRPDPGAHACSGLHLRTSGPSQPRADRPAAHGTAPVRALTTLLATRSPLQANPDRPRLLARQGHTTACPPCTAAVPS